MHCLISDKIQIGASPFPSVVVVSEMHSLLLLYTVTTFEAVSTGLFPDHPEAGCLLSPPSPPPFVSAVEAHFTEVQCTYDLYYLSFCMFDYI